MKSATDVAFSEQLTFAQIIPQLNRHLPAIKSGDGGGSKQQNRYNKRDSRHVGVFPRGRAPIPY